MALNYLNSSFARDAVMLRDIQKAITSLENIKIIDKNHRYAKPNKGRGFRLMWMRAHLGL